MKRACVRIATTFFGVVIALAGAVAPANAAGLENAWLQNVNSGKCALIQSTAEDAVAIQYECLDYSDQKWSAVDRGNGQFQIRNANSGKCLLVRGFSNNTVAVQYTCLDYADQLWRFNPYPGRSNAYWLQNVNSGKCLLAFGGSDYRQLEQYDCLEYTDQAWGLYI